MAVHVPTPPVPGPPQTTGALPGAKFAQAKDVILSRCSMCHAAEPVWLGITTAPKGVRLDDAEHIRQHARLIELYAVRSHAMPPGNITEISLRERAVIAGWLAAGAPAQ